ncbi:hypothetical protein AciM339_0711 [Aciduliprofundum sp. MAR08-339]|uniref:AAA family ATPase n=1 Tax=Aciduliprofundum sp. (strain MAR08-339) TaxID=673860 RepID=UPI0002A4A8DA|nr:hypothetical protein AciM339_0711 [Aciduliprofundum sp. MAR08-339]
MIEYDYVLERDEGNEIRKFTPNEKIGKKLPNIVLIEGPNSIGKSTLLNMLAIALYGLKNNENITHTLLKDMKKLIDGKKNKIEFKIKINIPNETLISEKTREMDNPIVYLFENGKKTPISPERFNKEYRLIYDIPDNPREKIKNAVEELVSLYTSIGTALSDFRKYIEKVQEEIYNSQDPDMIKKLEKRIEDYKKRITEEEKKYNGQNALLEDLQKYRAVKFFVENYMMRDIIKNRMKNIKREDKKSKKKIEKYNNFVNNLKKLIDEVINSKEVIIDTINDLGYPDLIREIPNIKKSISNATKNLAANEDARILAIARLQDLKNKVNDILNEREKIIQEELIEIEIIQKLINVLRDFSSYNIELPGTNIAIEEYIKKLEEEYSSKKFIQEEYELLKKIVREIDSIEYILDKTIPIIIKNIKKLGITEDDFPKDPGDQDNSLEELEKKLKNIEDKVENYGIKCIEYGFGENGEIDLSLIFSIKERFEEEEYIKDYMDLDETSFEDKLIELRKSIEKSLKEIGKFKALLEKEEKQLKKMKSLPEHKYQSDKENIEKLTKIISRIERKFMVEFPEYNNALQHSKNSIDLDEWGFIKYHELVGKYLGKKIKTIKYVNEKYDVEKVDMINDTIYLNGGKIIDLTNLGTGHSLAAYIMSLLNKDDPRKIIALFDESYIDSKTLAPVIDRCNILYSKGKLIAFVITRFHDGGVVVTNFTRGDLNE